MSRTHRRAFLQGSAAVLAGTLARPTPAEEKSSDKKPGDLPILDTHQHLWDLRKFRLPWIKKGSELDRNFLLADYREAAGGLHITRTVYMEVDVDPSQQVAEAEYVTELGRSTTTAPRLVGAVISGRPASEDFAKYLGRFKGSDFIKGLRQVLHGPGTPAGYCLQKSFIRGIRLLGERNLSFDLCMRPAELGDAAKLLDECPDTRFILDHCGNPDVQAKDLSAWKRDVEAIARKKGVACKVSGIVASAPEKWTADDLAPVVKHVLEVFGPERVMFGGDWPVCLKRATLRQWVEALKAIVADRKAEEQRKLFHDNAVRVYGLKRRSD